MNSSPTSYPLVCTPQEVLAILAGRQTQVRRPITPPLPHRTDQLGDHSICLGDHPKHHDCSEHARNLTSPFGGPQDLLLVQEQLGGDGQPRNQHQSILLEVSEVRIQRLQDISEADCLRSGISEVPFRPDDGFPMCIGYMVGPDDGKSSLQTDPRITFQRTWDRDNEDSRPDAAWAWNPLVWAVTFRRTHAP